MDRGIHESFNGHYTPYKRESTKKLAGLSPDELSFKTNSEYYVVVFFWILDAISLPTQARSKTTITQNEIWNQAS